MSRPSLEEILDKISDFLKRSWFYILVAAAVVGGLLLSLPNVYLDESKTRERVALTITRDFGSGLLIAAVFGFTVEYYFSRRREDEARILQQEINADVFSAVLGQNLPPSINREIETHLLQQPFLREDYKITVYFQPCATHPGHLRSEITMQYGVTNVSRHTRDFPLHHFLEREVPEPECEPNFTSLIYKVGSDEPKNLDISSSCEEDGPIIRYRKPITMEAKGSDRASASIEIRGFQCHPTRNFSVWSMTYMTNGLEMTYTLDPAYHVSSSPHHPSRELYRETHTGGTHRFEVLGGLLPYQGIIVNWEPRQAQGQSEEAHPADPRSVDVKDARSSEDEQNCA